MLDGDSDSLVLDEDEGIELELNRNVRFFFTRGQHRKENAVNAFQFRLATLHGALDPCIACTCGSTMLPHL